MMKEHKHEAPGRSLLVKKFGGTSVGNAECIRQVSTLIAEAHAQSDLVVVVSALAGVTNELIRAAECAARGQQQVSQNILAGIEQRHKTAIEELCRVESQRALLVGEVSRFIHDATRWCDITAAARELTPRMRDAISSLGERMSCPLLAATLRGMGMRAEAIEGTELIVTDGFHGAAEPRMELTRELTEARLRGLLANGTIPVVTGFIGASEQGVLTTLGRGGSDYSATILAAALRADEVTIWTDVDGIYTADPHLVPGARTIVEISYSEAAELAHFGAKVLHPKTLWPVNAHGIPVVIRNTFTPDSPGTRIVPDQMRRRTDVKAVALVREASLMVVSKPDGRTIGDTLERAARAAETVRAELLLLACSPGNDAVTISVASSHARELEKQLNREFCNEPGYALKTDADVSVTTLVGERTVEMEQLAAELRAAITAVGTKVIAAGLSASAHAASFVVKRSGFHRALIELHERTQPEWRAAACSQATAAPAQ